MRKPLVKGFLPVARVLRAHGTHGAMRLRLSCPSAQLQAWPLVATLDHDRLGQHLLRLGQLRSVSADEMLADLRGAYAREEVDRWRGGQLWLPSDVLPPPGDSEVYLYTLIDKTAARPDGRPLGVVVAVYDHGAGTVLGLRRASGGDEDVLLPLAAARIVAVDEAAGCVVIDVADDVLSHDA